jgi:hypothetical protein
MKRSLWWIPLVAALALAVPPAARAAEPAADADQEGALREKANALMASSSWTDALPLWAKLYALEGKPLDLWNAAVCQYHLAQAGQATPNQAIALLQQYRDSPSIPDEKKAKAQRYIGEMKVLEGHQAAAASAAAPPAAAAVVSTPTPTPTPSPAPGDKDPGRGLRIAGWAVGGVGVAALATGVYFSFRAHSLDNQVTNEGTFSASDDSSGHLASTMQFVMYGVGAAALVTAGVLYYFGLPHAEAPSVALAPMAGPGRAGAVLEMRF